MKKIIISNFYPFDIIEVIIPISITRLYWIFANCVIIEYNIIIANLRTGMKISTNKKPDISFWAGSNDYIPFEFFEQVINYYSEDKLQLYGINNYKNGSNISIFCKYDGIKNTINDTDLFLWDGTDSNSRCNYLYKGGIIGINKNVYNNFSNLIEKWNYDEGANEKLITQIQNIDIFYSKQIYWFNIKTISNSNISNFEYIKKSYGHQSVKNIDIECYQKIIEELKNIIIQ